MYRFIVKDFTKIIQISASQALKLQRIGRKFSYFPVTDAIWQILLSIIWQYRCHEICACMLSQFNIVLLVWKYYKINVSKTTLTRENISKLLTFLLFSQCSRLMQRTNTLGSTDLRRITSTIWNFIVSTPFIGSGNISNELWSILYTAFSFLTRRLKSLKGLTRFIRSVSWFSLASSTVFKVFYSVYGFLRLTVFKGTYESNRLNMWHSAPAFRQRSI